MKGGQVFERQKNGWRKKNGGSEREAVLKTSAHTGRSMLKKKKKKGITTIRQFPRVKNTIFQIENSYQVPSTRWRGMCTVAGSTKGSHNGKMPTDHVKGSEV